MKYKRLFFILTAVTSLLRLLVVGRIGLGDDEAHYFAYSRFLDLSFYDHPPAIGYIIKISTLVFGNNEFAVRLPAVVFFIGISFLVFQLARKMFDERVAFWSVALLNVTPVFSFLGAVLTVPDAPLAFFWMAFIYLFWRTVQGSNASLWYALGALLGVGLLSKYNAILLVPSAALFLLFSPRHRRWLFEKEPYFALGIAFLLFVPVIMWNLENGWASFGFQLRHGFGGSAPVFSALLLGRSLGAQAGYISPLLFILHALVLALLGIRAFAGRDEKALFLFSFSFPTLFLFNAVASFNEILPHWPATGYLTLTIAVAKYSVDSWQKGRWFFKGFSVAAWALAIFLSLLIPVQALFKVVPVGKFLPAEERAKIEDGITKEEKADITNEIYGWPVAGKKIAEYIAGAPEPKPFIFTHRHYIASQLTFYVPGHPRIYCLSERVDAYDFWQRNISELDGRDALFVTDNRFFTDPMAIYPFKDWKKTETLDIYRNGKKVRVFFLTPASKFDFAALDNSYRANLAGEKVSLEEGLRKFDRNVFMFINRDRHLPALDFIMEVITFIGYGVPLIIIGAIILWFMRRKYFWKELMWFVIILAAGGILVQLIKHLVGRARPPTIFGNTVHLLGQKLYFASFPSGHAQASFSAATYLASCNKRYAWAFFLSAAAIGFSRIYVGVHFPIDVAAGAIIGIAFTLLMLHFAKIHIVKR